MTIVDRSEECFKRFQKDFKKGLFSNGDGAVIKAWIREMEQFGPEYIVNNPHWRDHELEREWAGYRASCFSLEGRIIYKITNDNNIEICLIQRITPNHDYTRKDNL